MPGRVLWLWIWEKEFNNLDLPPPKPQALSFSSKPRHILGDRLIPLAPLSLVGFYM